MTERTKAGVALQPGNQAAHGVSLGEAFRVWLRIALLSFGGPAGQISMMHRILVDELKWVSESRFLHALNYCMLLPGPEAQQLATYIGWLMHRTPGGIIAGGLFVLPGAIAIMALSLIYAAFGQVGIVSALFFGLKAAVLAIVLQAVQRVGKSAQKRHHARPRGGGLCRHILLRPAFPADYSDGGRDRFFRRSRRASRLFQRRRP
jgi:chromate transporter